MSFFEKLDKVVQAESGGGGRVGKIEIALGYKAFIPGASNEDSFFPCDFENEKDKVKAKTACEAFIAEAGVDKRPFFSMQIKLFKDNVLNGDVSNWQGDQHYVYPVFTDNYKQGVLPALREAMEKAEVDDVVGTHWARIAWRPDMSEPQRMRSDDPDKPELFAFVAEVYESKKVAKAAAESIGTSDSFDFGANDKPDGMELAAWESNKEEILADCLEEGLEAVADDWDIDIDWLRDYCQNNEIDFKP